MKSSIKYQSSSSRGFTILEVLVASVIMGLVLFVLVSTANTSLTLWRDTRDKISVDQEGRTGVAILEWDLKNIVQPVNLALRPNLAAETNSLVPLRFLTAMPADYQADAADVGEVCFVEYQFSNNALKRAFKGSSDTFKALQDGIFPTVSPGDFELVATNLFQFKVWGYTSNNTEITYPEKCGPQGTSDQVLQTIEYRLEAVDPKFLKLFIQEEKFGSALQYQTS